MIKYSSKARFVDLKWHISRPKKPFSTAAVGPRFYFLVYLRKRGFVSIASRGQNSV